MRILYDTQAFDIQKSGGVSNVFSMIVNGVAKKEDVLLRMVATDNMYMLDSGYPSREATLKNLIAFNYAPKISKVEDINWVAQNRMCSIDDLKNQTYDIFHPTHIDTYFLEHVKSPYVVTMHDLAFERLKDYIQFNHQMCYDDFKRRKDITEHAAKVIAISEATKKDLMEIYDVPEEKIDVVYNAYRELPENYEYKEVFDFPYILYVGTRLGPLNYKCFLPFINQVVPFLKAHKDFKVVCTGPDFLLFEKDIFRQYGIEGRVVHKFATEDELNSLYHYAFCFVFPSEFEGFGLPILEAYKNGCPALLNDIPVFHEVADESGIYFDITDGTSLNSQLEGLFLLTDSDRSGAILKQKERLPLFTADKMVDGYINVYKKALNGR